MSDAHDPPLFAPWTIDHELVTLAVRGMRSRPALPVAQAFAKNIGDIAAILDLPLHLAGLQALEKHVLLSVTQGQLARVRSDPGAPPPSMDDFKRDVRRLHQTEFERFKAQPATQAAYRQEARRQLNQLGARHEQLYPQLRSLFSTAIVSAWTAFECAAGDTWAVALNAQAGRFAKAGFDTETLLAALTRHSSVAGLEGIAQAYALFENSLELSVALASPDLHELHATRNVLVHYNGVINKRFKEKVETAAQAGDQVPLDGAGAARLVNAAIMGGCAIIQFVDDWLVRHASA
ncbi:MAG TPA: hypothetical protein VGE07_07905 [Herpetosiphonaceae bacterium]